MERPTLPNDRVSEAARAVTASFNRTYVDEVIAAIGANRIVVVGMSGNPFVRRARQYLAQKGVAFKYLEYGSYVSKWRERLAIKLWAGYPYFPMVFVDGVLIGGFAELEQGGDAMLAPRAP